MNWYEYPICVPFNDPNYDVQYGGSHDLDVATPPNTPITALLPGTISNVGTPVGGMQVGVKLDTAYHGIPYMNYLHLSAVRPGLSVGEHINAWDIIGWSGGCTEASQYAGTSNPTGHNFLNTPDQSSRPQTGIALMYGPEYGVGAGWTPKPDPALDPTSLLHVLPSQSKHETLCTVTVDQLHIRAQPTSRSELIAAYPRGTVLNFVEVVRGENVDGNSHWGHSQQGHYFWLGGTDHPNG
jgi:hypothetical protein